MIEAGRREQLKTGLLVGLMLTSLFQVGIHWSRQLQWNPFSFASGLFHQSAVDPAVNERFLDARKVDYITPNRIVISDEQSGQWALDRAGDAWKTAWKDLKQEYLPLLATEKWDKQLLRTTWQQILAENRIVLFEFERPIPADLLPWLTTPSSERTTLPVSPSISDIEKIAMVPKGSVNNNINTLYVLSSDGVYRFSLELSANALPKDWYLMDSATLATGENQLLGLMGKTFNADHVRPDLLMAFDEPTVMMMPVYEANLPGAVPSDGFVTDNLQALQESVLLNRKDSLLTGLDSETGDVTFSDWENTFRIDSSANLTYQYLPGPGTKGTSMEAAFIQAVDFLEERRSKLGNTDIILYDVVPMEGKQQGFAPRKSDAGPLPGFSEGLSSVMDSLNGTLPTAEASGSITRTTVLANGDNVAVISPVTNANAFVFTFAYRVDGYTVLMKNAEGKTVPPITVTAIADRVVSCEWCIRAFTPIANRSWDLFFMNFYYSAIETYPFLMNKEQELSVLKNGYLLSEKEPVAEMRPEWIFETSQGTYTLPMQQGGE